jgi:hypothetical protein
MADATVTTNTFTIEQLPTEGDVWHVSLYSADWSTVGVLKAAVTGKSHYITRLNVRTATTTNLSIGSGGTGTDAVTTIHIGLIPLNAACGVFPWNAPPGMGLKCTSATEITLETSGAAPLWVEVWGKTCSDNL